MPRSAKVTEATALPYDRQGWLAVAVLAIGLAMVAGDFLIASSNFSTAPPSSILFATVPYWVIGAFLLWRQPRVRIGWVLLAFAFFWSLTFLSIDFAQLALQRGMGGTLFSAWVGEWAWLLALLIVFVVIPLLFPTGRPQSRGWATVLKSSMGFAVVFVVATTFQRYFDTGVRFENPWARLPIDDVETSCCLSRSHSWSWAPSPRSSGIDAAGGSNVNSFAGLFSRFSSPSFCLS